MDPSADWISRGKPRSFSDIIREETALAGIIGGDTAGVGGKVVAVLSKEGVDWEGDAWLKSGLLLAAVCAGLESISSLSKGEAARRDAEGGETVGWAPSATFFRIWSAAGKVPEHLRSVMDMWLTSIAELTERVGMGELVLESRTGMRSFSSGCPFAVRADEKDGCRWWRSVWKPHSGSEA